jgi:hypothetical protein
MFAKRYGGGFEDGTDKDERERGQLSGSVAADDELGCVKAGYGERRKGIGSAFIRPEFADSV